MRFLTFKRAAAAGRLTEARADKLSVAACELELMELGRTDCKTLELMCVPLAMMADEVAGEKEAEKKQAAAMKKAAADAP